MRRRKENIDDPTRSARGRNSIHASRSSYGSGSSQKRATDLRRTAKNRYQNAHSRDLPSRLRQTLPRATDPPLSLMYDRATTTKTKEKEDMGRVADVFTDAARMEMGNVEIDHIALVGERYSR